MPNHPPITLSYKDAKFCLETYGYCKELTEKIDEISVLLESKFGLQIKPDQYDSCLGDDIDRCINILEKEDEV